MRSARSPAFAVASLVAAALLAACASDAPSPVAPASPAAIRARMAALLPAGVADRPGWALDTYAALVALRIEPSDAHVCAVYAIVEQESTFRADPSVPRLGALAREEIDRRADRAGVPRLLVHGALLLRSPDSRSWGERIDAARTEKELSDLFEDFVDQVPLGRRLLAGYNPVRTGGSMQVSIEFAERHAQRKAYPYRQPGSVRDEVFTRRGGLYFGIAHLLDYPAGYDRLVYRFADFNAGQWASRNAAFQSALALASGLPLDLDGDLVVHGGEADRPGATERAARSIEGPLEMGDADIRRALEKDEAAGFESTELWRRVFALAERKAGRALPRAVLPTIRLTGPKITRPLTTEWFARRVDERYARCLTRAAALPGA